MLFLSVFAWISYIIICVAACIIIYEFLEERFPFFKKRKGHTHDSNDK